MIRLLLSLLLVSGLAHADLTLSVGVGKGALAQNGTAFERTGALGVEHVFSSGVFLRPELGYYLDRESSFWVAPLIGVRSVSQSGTEAHIGVGPGYLQNPDGIVLGGHVQFSFELGMGLTDENFFIGLVWKHLSSAFLYPVNQGRDLLCFQVRVIRL